MDYNISRKRTHTGRKENADFFVISVFFVAELPFCQDEPCVNHCQALRKHSSDSKKQRIEVQESG